MNSVLPVRQFRNAEELQSAHDGEIVRALNERYAKLNEKWAEAEADLQRFPIPSCVTHGCVGTDDCAFYIGFVKVKGAWRICFGQLNYPDLNDGCDPDQVCDLDDGCDPDQNIDWCPVAECSLENRLWLVQHFAALRSKVRKAAEKTVAEVDEAISKLEIELL